MLELNAKKMMNLFKNIKSYFPKDSLRLRDRFINVTKVKDHAL